jgi:hypothetical protein
MGYVVWSWQRSSQVLMFAGCILRQPLVLVKVLLAVGMEAHGRPLNSY